MGHGTNDACLRVMIYFILFFVAFWVAAYALALRRPFPDLLL